MSHSDKPSAPSRVDAAPSWRLMASGALGLIAVIALVVTSTRAVRVPSVRVTPRAAEARVNAGRVEATSAMPANVDSSANVAAAVPIALGSTVSTASRASSPASGVGSRAAYTQGERSSSNLTARALVRQTEPTITEASEFAIAAPALPLTATSSGTTPYARPARVPRTWHRLTSYPGVAWAATEITDASAGTAAMSGARSLRTHNSLSLSINMDSLIGVHGLKLYLQYKTRWGRNGSGAAAFVQNFSNIDADDFHAFGEAWIEQRMLQDKLRIKAGRLDFNSEFAGTDNGAAFLNASMGFSPSITAAPTFPLPVTAFNVIATPNDNLSISAGIFDGLSGAPAAAGHASLFQIAQATELWTLGGTGLSGRAAIGAWRHTGVFAAAPSDSAAGQSLAGTRGWYATLDQTLWRGATRTPNDDSNRARIAAYAQFGHSDPHVEAVHVHQGGGMTFTGMLSARPSDLLGVGTTRAAWANGHELIGEVFYQFPVTSHLSFVADLQHVNRWTDGTDVQRGVVATWRTILTF